MRSIFYVRACSRTRVPLTTKRLSRFVWFWLACRTRAHRMMITFVVCVCAHVRMERVEPHALNCTRVQIVRRVRARAHRNDMCARMSGGGERIASASSLGCCVFPACVYACRRERGVNEGMDAYKRVRSDEPTHFITNSRMSKQAGAIWREPLRCDHHTIHTPSPCSGPGLGCDFHCFICAFDRCTLQKCVFRKISRRSSCLSTARHVECSHIPTYESRVDISIKTENECVSRVSAVFG